MKKCFFVALAFCALVGLVARQLEARPGGSRGGARRNARPHGDVDRNSQLRNAHPSTGPRLNAPTTPGNGSTFRNGQVRPLGSGPVGSGKLDTRRPGSGKVGPQQPSARSNARVGAAQDKFSRLQANFTSRNEPFSAAWYADHPRAWQYAHPHADAWAVATLAATTAWLGVGAVYPGTYVGTESYYTSDGTVADTDDNYAGETSGSQVQDDEQVADEAVDAENKTAAQLAAEGAVDVPDDAEFLPLGVFALAPVEQEQATSVVQLAVTHDGILRGSYVDLLSDQEQTIVGAVDRVSQRVAWTLGKNGPVVFETSLETLTQTEGPVVLQFADGRQQEYTLARFESRTSERN